MSAEAWAAFRAGFVYGAGPLRWAELIAQRPNLRDEMAGAVGELVDAEPTT